MLLDLNLPGDTGWDLLRGPALAAAGSPPVVITSATTVSPKRLAEFGCAGYLPKPFPLETLVATIERLIAPGGDANQRMTDLQILLIARRRAWSCSPATWSCATGCADERARASLAGLAARFVFVYLLWALLRPEDF